MLVAADVDNASIAHPLQHSEIYDCLEDNREDY